MTIYAGNRDRSRASQEPFIIYGTTNVENNRIGSVFGQSGIKTTEESPEYFLISADDIWRLQAFDQICSLSPESAKIAVGFESTDQIKNSDVEILKDLKPLFLPLNKEYYYAFTRGNKTHELREYGKRWTEKTCIVGRLVTLSMGYGKQERHTGTIVSFEKVAATNLSEDEQISVLDVYGNLLIDIAKIGIKLAD